MAFDNIGVRHLATRKLKKTHGALGTVRAPWTKGMSLFA